MCNGYLAVTISVVGLLLARCEEIVDETEQLLTDLTRTYRQIFGRQYPDTQGVEGDLETFRTWKAKSPFR